MSNQFTGRWLVSEYVYNPDGTFAGIVQQKRYVERITDTQLRVIQDCEPSPELASHPMANFRGHWEFDLHIRENQREYHGLDVVGTGIPYSAGSMLGEGIWTRFGYNFTSFGLLPSPDRQLTGGAFFHTNQMIARIVGVATPETENSIEQFPNLQQTISLNDYTKQCSGTGERFSQDGTFLSKTDITLSWDSEDTLTVEHNSDTDILQGRFIHEGQSIAVYGKRKQYGCLIDDVLYSATGVKIQSQAVFDTEHNTLVIVRQIRLSHKEQFVDILMLH